MKYEKPAMAKISIEEASEMFSHNFRIPLAGTSHSPQIKDDEPLNE